ncbi:MAG: hypothetical protein HY393_03960 [Candidatus Diapherotrites archaeon]|nr:hypothetical protein [Candidatus Diapherotrites archaeon]
MSAPNTFALSKVTYFPEKRSVHVEFCNSLHRVSRAFPFFPSFFVSNAVSRELLDNVLSLYDRKRFKVVQHPYSFEVQAATFEHLKELARLVEECTAQPVSIMESERQFLCAQNWSYWDVFAQSPEGTLSPSSSLLEDCRLDFFSDGLFETLSRLSRSDPEREKALSHSLALSNVLRVPVPFVPMHRSGQAALWLENTCFSHAFAFPSMENLQGLVSKRVRMPRWERNITQVRFNALWSSLCSLNFYNLGLETVDCPCCVPLSVRSFNVLPHSLVKVRFLEDAFFFVTRLASWGDYFHGRLPARYARERFQQEQGLSSPAMGPFYRNQVESIPWVDAQELEREGVVRVVDERAEWHWHCVKKESFFALDLSRLNVLAGKARALASKMEEAGIQSNGLRASLVLQGNGRFLALRALEREARALWVFLPGFLKHVPCFGRALEGIQARVLEQFSNASLKEGVRPVQVSAQQAWVQGSNVLGVLQGFARSERMPVPEVGNKYPWRRV